MNLRGIKKQLNLQVPNEKSKLSHDNTHVTFLIAQNLPNRRKRWLIWQVTSEDSRRGQ